MITSPESSPNYSTASSSASIAMMLDKAHKAIEVQSFGEAEALLKRACKKAELHFGSESAAVASLLWQLSMLYEQAGDHHKADEAAEKVRTILASRLFANSIAHV